MATAHLTDLVVSRLKTPGIYYDSTTPAFGIRIGKHRKVWVITRGRDRQRVSIGQYPAMSLAEARKEAKKLLAEDPAERDARIKLSAAYEAFKVEHVAGKKGRTQYDYKRVIEKYLLPKLGTKQLAEVTYEDVVGATDKLKKSEKSHALAVARTFFRWCVKPPRRYIKHSPLEGLQIASGNKRKRVLKPEELKPVWTAAEEQGYPHGTIVKLLILNGQRRTETASLQWPWINEKDRTITLPETITKNGKEHTFPYGDLTAGILETIPRLNSTPLLFPSRVSDDRPLSGWSKYKKQMTDGIAGWTLHDLRRTFRTLHAQFGTPAHIGERLINHVAAVTTDVEQIYDIWTYLPEMRKAVANFEARFTELLGRT